MRQKGVKLGVLGALTAAALLTGCDREYSQGRQSSLRAQEDYYSEQGQAREQEGTGGSGQAQLWLRQDYRVPYPPPALESSVARELGTGKPLKTGAHGAWVQGTYAVELGSGVARANTPSSSYQPREVPQGQQATPRSPSERGGEESR